MVAKESLSYKNIVFITVVALVMLATGFGIGRSLTETKVVTETVAAMTMARVTTEYIVETVTAIAVPEAKISVVDALGREVVFDKPPGRVVSLAPSITEILFSLGLQDRVVGVTSHCNYPPEVLQLVSKKEIAVIGGFWAPDLEKIVSLRPDLVIGSAGTPPHLQLKEPLEQAGIKVFYTRVASDKYDVYSDIRALAKVFGVEKVVEELIDRIEVDIKSVERAVPEGGRPKVLVLLGPPGWGLYSAGGNTFMGWLIRTAGGINIAERFTGWPALDYEFILSQDPDVIIVSAMGLNYTTLVREINETPLTQTKAFKTGRVYLVDQEANDILVRPGPRLGVAVRLLASILFPDIFGPPKIPVVYRIEESTASVTSAGAVAQLNTGAFPALALVTRGSVYDLPYRKN